MHLWYERARNSSLKISAKSEGDFATLFGCCGRGGGITLIVLVFTQLQISGLGLKFSRLQEWCLLICGRERQIRGCFKTALLLLSIYVKRSYV